MAIETADDVFAALVSLGVFARDGQGNLTLYANRVEFDPAAFVELAGDRLWTVAPNTQTDAAGEAKVTATDVVTESDTFAATITNAATVDADTITFRAVTAMRSDGGGRIEVHADDVTRIDGGGVGVTYMPASIHAWYPWAGHARPPAPPEHPDSTGDDWGDWPYTPHDGFDGYGLEERETGEDEPPVE